MALRIAAHLCGWPQEVARDHRRVMEIVSEAGYDGVEGFSVEGAEDLPALRALAAEYGLHLVNVGTPDPLVKAEINAELGNDAAEIPAVWKPVGKEFSDAELEATAEEVQPVLKAFEKRGTKPFHHIHLGTMLETTEDCARVLRYLPNLWLLFDTGHLLAARSNPMDVLARWPQRIGHVHLKNFWTADPGAGWSHRGNPEFWKSSRFCDLADGNVGFDAKAALDGLVAAGYAGWVAVEEDHPCRDIAAVVRDNREFLRGLGY